MTQSFKIVNNDNSLMNQEIIRYLKASEQQREEGSNVLKNYALLQKIDGKTDDYENLQQIIDEGKTQNKILEDMMAVNYHRASEMKRADSNKILRFYELVQRIGSVYG